MEKYIYINSEGMKEEIDLERWIWEAIYKDGTYLKQFDEETKIFHRIAEIDQEKLDVFAMQSTEDENKRYEIHFTEGMKLVHYYRHTVLELGTPNEKRFKFYCFGYKIRVGGIKKFIKTMLQILPNDMVSITKEEFEE